MRKLTPEEIEEISDGTLLHKAILKYEAEKKEQIAAKNQASNLKHQK